MCNIEAIVERCHRRWHNKHAIYFMPGIQVPPQSVKAKEEHQPQPDSEPEPDPDPQPSRSPIQSLWPALDLDLGRLTLARPVVCDNGMMVWWCMPSIHNNSKQPESRRAVSGIRIGLICYKEYGMLYVENKIY